MFEYSTTEYELVWHDLDNDRAWFADHPDRQYRVRPVLWGEGTATRVESCSNQIARAWFAVRRDLEYAALDPVAVPIDDEELCRLLFKAFAGLGSPWNRYLKKAQGRWLALLDQMPETEERKLARSRLIGESSVRKFVRMTTPPNQPSEDAFHPRPDFSELPR
jgi:hypothetical protein